jgi:opacity protein-like surface antigen
VRSHALQASGLGGIDSGNNGINVGVRSCDFVGNKTKTKMKKLLVLMSLVAIATVHAQVPAAVGPPKTPEAPKKAAAKTASWIDSLSVAPVGAIKTEHLDGPSQWGAGLDVGYRVNPFVSIHVVNLAFEGPGQVVHHGSKKNEKWDEVYTTGPNSWGGSAIDETLIQVDSKISSLSKEKFSLHLVGGAQTDWNDNNWGVNVGLRAVWDFNKRVGLSAGYDIRTWLKGETRVDSLASASLNFRL